MLEIVSSTKYERTYGKQKYICLKGRLICLYLSNELKYWLSLFRNDHLMFLRIDVIVNFVASKDIHFYFFV